jgi:GTP-binding protein Era
VVALVGRPNAGKSTLVNALVGEKVAIVSSKPQTTRDRIAGIVNTPHLQALVIDTPGVHDAWTELNRRMVRRAWDAVAEADAVVWVVDLAAAARRARAGEPWFDEEEERLVTRLLGESRPLVVVPNKIDLVGPEQALPVIEALRARLGERLVAAVPMSAERADGVEALLGVLRGLLPAGDPRYPTDQWTDATERFLVAEAIREPIVRLTKQEIPYATAVEIEQFDESERETRDLVRIHAAIWVDRPQQKPILVGKGGAMIKRIGTEARHEIERLLGCRVHLELFVKVERDWTATPGGVRRAGYT